MVLDVNGNWGEWGAYGECSLPCGGGLKQRIRNCDNPMQEGAGADCAGDGQQITSCNVEVCTEGI